MADSRPSSRSRPRGETIGVMDCWSCVREVPVKQMPSGKISAACPWCDFPHYANEGTEHARNLLRDVKPLPGSDKEQPASSSATATSSASVPPATSSPATSSSADQATEKKDKAPPARSWSSPLFGRP